MELYYRRKIEAEKKEKETFDASKRNALTFDTTKSAMRRTG